MNTLLIDLPDGEYDALWTGYNMEILSDNKKLKVVTTTGVKGINCKVKVIIKSGIIKDYYEQY